jgi:hypothetical protein
MDQYGSRADPAASMILLPPGCAFTNAVTSYTPSPCVIHIPVAAFLCFSTSARVIIGYCPEDCAGVEVDVDPAGEVWGLGGDSVGAPLGAPLVGAPPEDLAGAEGAAAVLGTEGLEARNNEPAKTRLAAVATPRTKSPSGNPAAHCCVDTTNSN